MQKDRQATMIETRKEVICLKKVGLVGVYRCVDWAWSMQAPWVSPAAPPRVYVTLALDPDAYPIKKNAVVQTHIVACSRRCLRRV